MASFLEIAQGFCAEYNLHIPDYLKGSDDAGVKQIRQLMNSVGEEIWAKTNWRDCVIRVEWTSVAGDDQGSLAELCPTNLDHVIPRTFWDNTLRRPIYGPVSDMGWQQLKAYVPGSPLYQYTIREGRILFNPSMVEGHTLTLMYKTKNWFAIAGTDPVQGGFVIDEDDDVPYFTKQTMTLGLKAKWREVKGMDFRQARTDFLDSMEAEASRMSVQPIIHMDDPEQTIRPGIWVPYGNWNVSQ